MRLLPIKRYGYTYLPLVLLLSSLSNWAWGKTTDREQAMTIDSTRSDCQLVGGNGRCRFNGDVVIVQGTLEIKADQADVMQKEDSIDRVVITGQQATFKQQMDDDSWMNARADHMDYEVGNETIILTGNYYIESGQGSNSGQRLVYHTRSGTMQSGGDGTRVRTVLPPRRRVAADTGEP